MSRTLAVACALVTAAPALGADPVVRFESGRLWVRTEGEVTAGRLLESISEKTGIELVIDPELAGARLELRIDGVELERALRQVVAKIPGAGGQTMSYVSGDTGKARLARATVFGVGHAPAGGPVQGTGGAAETHVVPAAMPSTEREAPDRVSAAALEASERQMVESGVPEETAREFNEMMSEAARVQKTPGAAEAIMRSERYRELTRKIANAQGKGAEAPRGQVPPR